MYDKKTKSMQLMDIVMEELNVKRYIISDGDCILGHVVVFYDGKDFKMEVNGEERPVSQEAKIKMSELPFNYVNYAK